MKTSLFCFSLCAMIGFGARAATLSGTVTRSDTDAAVAGATVLVRGTGLLGLSGADGTYTISDIPQGSFGLTCSAPGLLAVSIGAQTFDEDRSRDFHLDPPAEGTLAFSGTTTCAGLPCGGVLVEVRQDGRTQAQGLSAADGSYRVVGLAAGTYDVRGIRRAYYLDEISAVEALLETPPVVDLALTAAPAGFTISGLVGLSDNPLDRSGSTVRLFGGPNPVLAATTAGGAYSLTGAPAGLLSLSASHSGYDPQGRIDVLVQGDRSLNFVLNLQGGSSGDDMHTVSGTVRLEDPDGGDPITAIGSRVSIWTPGSTNHNSASTRADGSYSLTGIPTGSYLLSAAREGYLSPEPQAIDLDGDTNADFELALDPDYDWGPGREDGVLGCTTAGRIDDPGVLLLGALLAWARRRMRRRRI